MGKLGLCELLDDDMLMFMEEAGRGKAVGLDIVMDMFNSIRRQ